MCCVGRVYSGSGACGGAGGWRGVVSALLVRV